MATDTGAARENSPAALGDVRVGDYVLSVDGAAIDGRTNLDSLLLYKINRRVALRVASNTAGAGGRDVAVRPVNGATEKNLVYRTSHGGFHLHYGKDNIVRNNIFALSSGEQQIQRSREEPHLSFTFEHNIVYWTNGSAMTLSGPTNIKFDHNLYSGIEPDKFRAADKTWAQWRAAGSRRDD